MIQNKEAMETKFNFNSQICTSRSQSERLLALGLKKETADCTLIPSCDNDGTYVPKIGNLYLELRDGAIPAWSLDRLRELIPENIFTAVGNQLYRVMYSGVLTYEEWNETLVSFEEANIYDRCISCIEWLIKEGYFNKEYLV